MLADRCCPRLLFRFQKKKKERQEAAAKAAAEAAANAAAAAANATTAPVQPEGVRALESFTRTVDLRSSLWFPFFFFSPPLCFLLKQTSMRVVLELLNQHGPRFSRR